MSLKSRLDKLKWMRTKSQCREFILAAIFIYLFSSSLILASITILADYHFLNLKKRFSLNYLWFLTIKILSTFLFHFQEEYLLGKAVGKDFEKQGTMGQINAVEYGECFAIIFFMRRWAVETLRDLESHLKLNELSLRQLILLQSSASFLVVEIY